jgi:hypothetical protein
MRSTKLVLATLTLLVAASFPLAASAELAQWDQARVTKIARELATACDAWQTAVLDQGGDEIGSGSAEGEFGIAQNTQLLQERSLSLADHLEKGDGHDATLDIYRSMKETMDDTRVQAQESELDEPTMDAWSKLEGLFRQISPYYDPQASDE